MKRETTVLRLPLWLFAIVVIFVAGVIAAGAWLTVDQTRGIRRNVENQLVSIGELKVGQIVEWRQDRLRHAATLAADPIFQAAVAAWLSTGDAADAAAISTSLQVRMDSYGFSTAAIIDENGKGLLHVGNFEQPVAPIVLDAENTALRQGGAVLTDLHRDPTTNRIHVDAIAAVFSPGSKTDAVGYVLLRTDADTYLYPLLASWPVPSSTAESLIVRRDGDSVLYMSGVRADPNAALNLRLSLSTTTLPATMAILGKTGVVKGTDYRGEEVLAALEPVPDTPWFLVAKEDAAEALGQVRTRTGLLAALLSVMVLVLLGTVGLMQQWRGKLKAEAAYRDSLAYRASLERFHLLVQSAQDAIILADEKHQILDVNNRALEMYGYPREEFLDLTLEDTVPPEFRSRLEERLRMTLASESATHELAGMRKDGTQFPIEVSDKTFSVDGRMLIQAIIRDISDRRKAEHERLELERRVEYTQRLESLSVLAGGVAHDFNNILTTILGNADLILRDMPLAAPGRQGVQEIVEASRRAADLCRQMLAYSGHGRFVVEEIDLGRLIDDMLDLLRSCVPKKIVLSFDLAQNLPAIRGDVSQISQIIMNLVINAAEAMGDRSGTITISTGAQECSRRELDDCQMGGDLPPGRYVTLEVSDTGAGMDGETQRRLFEPFFTTKFTGRGLGLSAALGIVRGHRGAIRVYSELGKGSTFKVLLPAVIT